MKANFQLQHQIKSNPLPKAKTAVVKLSKANQVLTNILRGTIIELDMSVATAKGHDRLRIAGAVHICAFRVGSHAENLLGWKTVGVLLTEGAATPASVATPLRAKPTKEGTVSSKSFSACIPREGQHADSGGKLYQFSKAEPRRDAPICR